VVTMPAGLQSEFLEKLNNLTHGRVQTKLMQ
jgi:ribosome maturation protein Sdo1